MKIRNPALDSLKECGLGRFAATDGCACMSFAIHGIHVDVSCRKSGGNTHPDGGTTVRVYSHHMDLENADELLRDVGREVARQLGEWIAADPETDFNIVLEEYR